MSFLFENKNEQKDFTKKENKKVLGREEKRLDKIADKNTKVIDGVKNKALKRKLHG